MLKEEDVKTLSQLGDDAVLEEAARRLQAQYKKEHGNEFMYGSFRFIFHDGRFQGIEDWPRNKRYISPKRFAGRSA
jgi:hypothetical protein